MMMQGEILQRQQAENMVLQIFIGEALIGGFDDLDALNKQGKLEAMLNFRRFSAYLLYFKNESD